MKVCETCGKKFTSLNGYRNLKKAHIRERLASGEEGLDASNLLFHCDKCGMVLKSKWALKYHMQSEHKKGTITCSECNLTFHTKKLFLQHENIAHSTDKKFECTHCGKRCGNLTFLKTHLMRHEEANFPCSHCPKVLRSSYTLEDHERRYHTVEKPFECSLCEKSFVSKRVLSQHMKGAHKMVGPKGGKAGWIWK